MAATLFGVVAGVTLILAGLADRLSLDWDRERLASSGTAGERSYWRVIIWRARWLAPAYIVLGVVVIVVVVIAALT